MEAVGQLTGGISHDFKNLLTGIAGSLEMIQLRIGQGRVSELGRYVAAAQCATRRATTLTQRLLAFSRQQSLTPTATDDVRLVDGMRDLIIRTIGSAIRVDVIGNAQWLASVDQNRLENALLDLCINARDAMPDGGSLTIETADRSLDAGQALDLGIEPGDCVELTVGDSGTGAFRCHRTRVRSLLHDQAGRRRDGSRTVDGPRLRAAVGRAGPYRFADGRGNVDQHHAAEAFAREGMIDCGGNRSVAPKSIGS